MAWVRFPMRRFAPSCYHYAGAALGLLGPRFHCRRQMHQAGDRAQNPLRMMHQPDQLAQVRPAAQVQRPTQPRMKMTRLADLNKQNTIAEMIDDSLPPSLVPPLDGQVEF